MVLEKNFRLWKQYDDEWNESETWTEKDYPYAAFRYFRQSGCFITSISILLRMFELEKEENPEYFNPLILCKKMHKLGAYDAKADVLPDSFSRLYPMEYIASVPFTRDRLRECIVHQIPCLAMVPGNFGPFHYVVPDKLEGERVKICDPGLGKEYLDEFSVCHYIVLFRKREFISNVVVKYIKGTLVGVDHWMGEFGLKNKSEEVERDILVLGLEKFGKELLNKIQGDYTAVLRNVADGTMYFIRNGKGPELNYCRGKGGKMLYGSLDYIRARKEYEQGNPIRPLETGEYIVCSE